MQALNTVIRFFQEGGLFMYPIVLICALGIAIAIERYLYISRSSRQDGQAWQRLMPLLRDGRYQEAYRLTSSASSALAFVLSHGLRRASISRDLRDIEAALEEGLMEVVPRFERRTHYLATFANVATLLGLLGTIIGLIQAFTAVSNADPAQKADLLSSSISVAMNTTAFGLMVAIPLLLIYTVLNTKTNDAVTRLESVSMKFLNMVTARRGE